jgi:hypothetical protein
MAGPALADLPGCTKAEIPTAALKGLQKAAKREAADALDLQTLFYCAQGESAQATVDTIPVPQADGSENLSTLLCSGPPDRSREWICHVSRYPAIRVAPSAGEPEVRVAIGERASADTTRDYALQAFALLHEPGRVAACPGTAGAGQSTESLLALLAQRHGPYTLVIAREGFALMRARLQVRFRSANAFNARAQLQCWEEQIIEE